MAPDIVVTAGHCESTASHGASFSWKVDDIDSCGDVSLVFDFGNYPDKRAVDALTVVSCKKVIYREGSFPLFDLAVLRLAQPITDRETIDYRRDGRLAEGSSVLVAGHPGGLPTKLEPAAVLVGQFTYRLEIKGDILGGNSGGPAASLVGGAPLLEGIVSSGSETWDYTYDDQQGCYYAGVCEQDKHCSFFMEASSIAPIAGLLDYLRAPRVEAINANQPVSDLSGTKGSYRVYSFEVPASATSVQFNLSQGSGNADLSVRQGEVPTRLGNRGGSEGMTNNESITIRRHVAGTWWVSVYGRADYRGAQLIVTHTN